MAIRAGKLFVSTNTSLHSIAVERCSRLQGCRYEINLLLLLLLLLSLFYLFITGNVLGLGILTVCGITTLDYARQL